MISLSGPGVSPYHQEAYRVEHMLRDAGVAEDQIAEAMAFFHHRATRLRRGDDLEEVLADQLGHRDATWYPALVTTLLHRVLPPAPGRRSGRG